MAIRKAMGEKILGIKTRVGGRLGGVEMARSEGYTEGSMPLSTIRADIDYAHEIARTKSGVIGVRV
jgi:small subunit ribosomal protein S3